MGLPIITAVVGPRRRPRHRRAGRARRRHPVQRPHPGHDDRARRRHRLRVVPHHPAPGPAARRRTRARVDRQRRGDVGQRHRLRGLHGRHRPALARRRRHPAGERPRPRLGDRRRVRGPGRDLAAPGLPRTAGSADQLAGAAGVPASQAPPASQACGRAGPGSSTGTRCWIAVVSVAGAGAADHPRVLARARSGGHRGDVAGHDRAPGLRPDHRRLRGRLQRPAAGGLGPRPGRDAERRVHQEVRQGDSRCRPTWRSKQSRAAEGAEAAREAAAAARGAAAVARAAEDAAGEPAGAPRTAGGAAPGPAGALEQQAAQLQQEQSGARDERRRSWSGGPRSCGGRPRRWPPGSARSRGSWPGSRRASGSSRAAIERAEDRPRPGGRLRARLAEVRAREAIVRQQLAPLERAGARPRRARPGSSQPDRPAARSGRRAGSGRPPSCERQKARPRAAGRRLQAQAAQLQAAGRQPAAAGRPSSRPQGDALQQQADELKAEQKQAQQEQKQAEKLQAAADRHGHRGRW